MTAAPISLLLLEDDRADAELLQAALAEFAPGEFAVTRVERLADAFARIQTAQFDVLLSDLGLPDSTGLATVQAIAARAPALPLVVLTGMNDEDLGRAVIEHGAQDYLVKGGTSGALIVRTLRYAIERKRLEIGLRAANEALAGRVADRTAELDTANATLLANAVGYRDLFDANPQPMYMYDPDTLRFVAVNDAAVAHYGWSREEFLAMTIADIRPAGYIQHMRDHIARIRRENINEVSFWKHRKKDGTLIDVEITSHAIEFGARPARVVIAHDVTERRRAEEGLRESEVRFRSLTGMSSDFYWETDAEHRFTMHDSSSRLSQAWASQPGTQIGKRRWEMAYLSPDEAAWEAHRAVLDAHGPFRDFEFSRRGADGAARHFMVSGEPVFDVSGAFRGYRGVGTDVTERKRAEEAVQESETRFRILTEMSSDFYWETDAEHRFTEGNTAANLSASSVWRIQIGKRRWEMPYRSPGEAGWQAHRAVLDAHRPFREFELSRLGADGTEYYLSVSGDPIFDVSGALKGYRGVGKDITGRKRAEEALRAAEAQFRSLVEQSIAGAYIIQEGRFAYVNGRCAEIFGYDSTGEMIGREVLSVIAEKDRDGVAEAMRQRMEGEEENLSYTFTGLRKDGSMIEVGAHGGHATHRGLPAVIGLMQDISEKRRAEEEIKRYVAQLEKAFMSTVGVATTLSEMRDPYTAGHERRVAEIAVAIGAELGFDARRLEGLRVAGYLHDIGKITVPSEILAKPGRLSPLEFKLIQGHPQASYDVLKDVEFPWPVAEVALQHHERIDGSGYPHGLGGEAILLEARIMAVADVVEAMASHRPYRPGLGIGKALAEIERGHGSAYDPAVADACLKLFREKGYTVPA